MLKIDLIQDAYSQATISGLTRKPTPQDLELALVRLEGMAAELEGRNICVNYNFTESPDPNDESGIDLQFRQAFASNLAMRVVMDFGLQPAQSLVLQASQSMSNMSARTAQTRQTPYPSRMPIGSGNTRRYNRWTKFYHPVPQSPQSCTTRHMDVSEINDFSESWFNYVDNALAETIVSYEMEVSSGLTVTGDSLDTPVISFRVEALKVGYQNVIFTVTTSTGRVDRREAPFQIQEIVEVTSDA